MHSEEIIMFGIVGAAFIAALLLSFFFGKRRNKLGLSIMGIIWTGFTGIMFFGMYDASGWDGLAYLLALIGISAPTGVGSLIGSLVGWAKSDKAEYEQFSLGAGQSDAATSSR